MLRIRSDGGALTSAQARAIGGISQDFARGTADITDRQNIQLHWIRIEDVPEIWDRLEARRPAHHRGLRRHPSRDPGLTRRRVSPPTRSSTGPRRSRRSSTASSADPEFSNLPRKFKTAISGSPRHDVAHEINDVSFVGVVHPEHGPGFDVWVGGGPVHEPDARPAPGRLGAPGRGPRGVGRGHRDLPGLRVPAPAQPGPAEVPGGRLGRRSGSARCWRPSTSSARCSTGRPPTPCPQGARDHVGIHPQRDGRVYVGAAPTVGRINGADPGAAGRPRRRVRRPAGCG